VTSHADLAGRCEACHASIGSAAGMGSLCLACHTDVAATIAGKTGLHGRLAATTSNCRDCHTEHRGSTASVTLADPKVFPHEETGYSLVAHQHASASGGLSCRDCHADSPTTYAKPDCVSCHQARDARFMATHEAAFGPTCRNCHDGVDHYGKAFSHASYQLTGAHERAQCIGCHQGQTTPAALKTTSSACIDCHGTKDIHEGRLGTSCAQCHTTEAWTGAAIDHAQTRFALAGKHAGVSCESCHKERQWTGVGTTCASCHAKDDPHAGNLGSDCASCHTASDWKNATFDHSKTAFKLTGAHAGTGCTACHAGGVFKGTPKTCESCHAGTKPATHTGVLGGACASCHTTAAWKPATFNHTKTAYPLTGAHLGVTCQKCHAGGSSFASAPTACASCHAGTKPATHTGVLGGACASCHTTKAWLPATFNHSKSYPLTGAHLGVTCQKCHAAGSTFASAPTACASCHTKPATHTGVLGGACASCHTTKAWKPATFNHSKSAYPLTGAHLGVTCQKCHAGGSTFASAPTACASCHTKPVSHTSAYGTACASCHTTKAWLPATFNHSKFYVLTGAHLSATCQKCHAGGVYAGTPTACASCHTKPATHNAAYGTACATCHTTKAWLPSTFNHSKSYQLTGAHLSVTCLKCHAGGVTKGTPTACASCHTKPASHTASYGTACASCHTTKAWLPATFNHNNAAFKLTGAHAGVTCTKCHKGGVYAGTPTACASCHTKPASHTASYGTICSSCHTTTAWLPASYNGVHTFPQTHHGAAGVCAKCHPSGPPAYTCASCHSNSSMTSKHSGVKSFSLTTCAACHPKGTGGG
jgi:hypothetical protein